MITIEINERTKAGKVLLQMARLLENKDGGVKIIDISEKSSKLGPKTEFEAEKSLEEILKDRNLTNKEKTFYKKFREAINESRALDAGVIKDRPLKEVLDEI